MWKKKGRKRRHLCGKSHFFKTHEHIKIRYNLEVCAYVVKIFLKHEIQDRGYLFQVAQDETKENPPGRAAR